MSNNSPIVLNIVDDDGHALVPLDTISDNTVTPLAISNENKKATIWLLTGSLSASFLMCFTNLVGYKVINGTLYNKYLSNDTCGDDPCTYMTFIVGQEANATNVCKLTSDYNYDVYNDTIIDQPFSYIRYTNNSCSNYNEKLAQAAAHASQQQSKALYLLIPIICIVCGCIPK